MNKEVIYEIGKKYRSQPRIGYSTKNSRKKADETIEVNRKEICGIIDDAYNLIFAHDHFLHACLFYEKILSILAAGEDDSVKCNECGGIYRTSWFDGECPYCEIDHYNHEIFATEVLGSQHL